MAPFRLELTAAHGALPFDTLLRVEYQGKLYYDHGKQYYGEKYDVRHPPTDNLDVCCREGTPVRGKLPSVPCASGPSPAPRDASPEAHAADGAGPSADARASIDASGPSDSGRSRDAATATDSGSRPGDAAAAAPLAILCELWTNGAAELVVTGSGYPLLDEMLTAERNDCSFDTRDVRVVWAPSDGGP